MSLAAAGLAAGLRGALVRAGHGGKPPFSLANLSSAVGQLSEGELREGCEALLAEDGSLDHERAVDGLQRVFSLTGVQKKYIRNLLRRNSQTFGAAARAIAEGDATGLEVTRAAAPTRQGGQTQPTEEAEMTISEINIVVISLRPCNDPSCPP
jgi:hypothetical protein